MKTPELATKTHAVSFDIKAVRNDCLLKQLLKSMATCDISSPKHEVLNSDRRQLFLQMTYSLIIKPWIDPV